VITTTWVNEDGPVFLVECNYAFLLAIAAWEAIRAEKKLQRSGWETSVVTRHATSCQGPPQLIAKNRVTCRSCGVGIKWAKGIPGKNYWLHISRLVPVFSQE